MDNKININVGELLKAQRESLHLEVEEVSRNLKVKVSDIILLEQNTPHLITGRIYLPGLVRQYAKRLKLKDDIIEQCLKNIATHCNVNNNQYQSINIDDTNNKTPSKYDVFYALLIFIIMSLILICFSPTKANKLAINDLIINQFKQKEL